MMCNIVLGKTYRDCVTGYEGVAVQRVENLHSRDRIALQSRHLTPEGNPHEFIYMDEDQLIEVDQ